jgi:DNA topoisomerase-1
MSKTLRFVDDSHPGITRMKKGRAWAYFDPEGTRITDRDEIDRLNAIALPPAYTDAWFYPKANGHLLATGIDARGRKQYRYHPEFRAQRDCLKFDGLARFGCLLPLVRKRVEEDLARRGLTRERAIASVLRLLDSTAIRIGNEAYAKSNKSFGATTLRMRHAAVSGQTLKLRFKAKSGKLMETRLTDRSLARFVRAMQDLPGQHLFQFLDTDGEPSPVDSGDVNDYLKSTMGEDFTAKHFRTWAASTAGFELIAESNGHVGMKALLAHVSDRLGNTPAIARKSYIHPAVLALVGDPDEQAAFRNTLRLPRGTRWLSRHERGLIAYLGKAPESAKLLAA